MISLHPPTAAADLTLPCPVAHGTEDLRVRKFSVSIAGRKTSISLEGPFRRRLQIVAQGGNRTMGELVTAIRMQYPEISVSSACRLYLLADALGALP